MKKILYLFLIVALCCTCIIFAEDESPNTIMYNSDMKISFNGKPIDFKDDQGNELEIFISDGVTYVPAIPVLNLMERHIESDDREILVKNNKKLSYVELLGNVDLAVDKIPLLRLLAHPEKTNSNQLCTEGWLAMENDRILLYVSKGDYDEKDNNRCVEIIISKDMQPEFAQTLKKYDGYCAEIYAGFNSEKFKMVKCPRKKDNIQ